MNTAANEKHFKIEKLETAPFGTNAYIIICSVTGDSVLVDAPGEAGKIISHLDGTNPRYILLTHSHFDHTGALKELKSSLNIPRMIHSADAGRLPTPLDTKIENGATIACGNLKLKVLHTPGHTPGSISLLIEKYLISGDTLFPGGPGRTDTPTDFKQIIMSLNEKVFILPEETLVFPGHGASTDIKKAKEEFAVFTSRSHPPNLCGDVLWLSS